jgi:hypothetical protein
VLYCYDLGTQNSFGWQQYISKIMGAMLLVLLSGKLPLSLYLGPN